MYNPLSASPYFDDFETAAPHYKILFRPGYAVQARELSQIQSLIQEQIKRFGDNVLKDGTAVSGGNFYFENDLLSIKLDPTYLGANVDSTKILANANIIGGTSNSIGRVKFVLSKTATDPIIVIVKLMSGDGFIAGETLSYVANSTTYNSNIQATTPFSAPSVFNIKSGIFYINGYFVNIDAESIVIDKYSNITSKKIGFIVTESISTEDDDEELLDNAQGTPNYAAPGAHRYKISVGLTTTEIDANPSGFIELARLVNGQVISKTTKTVYNVIGDEMAKRTFDESGDYVVNNFPLTLADATDPAKFNVVLDKGKAYVKGYEFTPNEQRILEVNRARTTRQADNIDTNLQYGNFVYATGFGGEFITSNTSAAAYSKVELHNVVKASVVGAGSVIGSANIRFVKYVSGTAGATAIYKLYLFNIVMTGGNLFKNLESIVIRSGATVLAGANVDLLSKVGGSVGGDVFLSGADSSGLVFPLNQRYVSTIRDSSNVCQSDFTFQRTYTNISFTGATGVATISTDNGFEVFQGGTGGYSSLIKNQYYHVVVTSVTSGAGVTVGQILDLTSAGRTVTGGSVVIGSPHSVTIDANVSGTNFVATIIATINANAQPEKTKTLSNYTLKIISSPSTALGGKNSLGAVDIYDIKSIHNTYNVNPSSVTVNSTTGEVTWTGITTKTDVTTNYKLDDGQRDDFYDLGAIELLQNPPLITNYLVVVYRNFTHYTSTGKGYFSVDSYTSSGVSYSDIPRFKSPTSGIEYELRDCLDFRPRISDDGLSFQYGQLPDPDFSFNSDYKFYLGRKDRLTVTSSQNFSYREGIPSQEPVLPAQESNSMTIFTLDVPPYTENIAEISVRYIENKRYTMRDIGKLEKRISNIEYYTQLSFLEQQAKEQSIVDSSNLQKFKNGIFVDSFTGETVQDVINPDFRCYLDTSNREVRAFTEIHNVDATFGSGTNVVRNGDLVTLSFTETPVASQLFATKSVNINPFNVVSFIGSVNLNPSQDLWVDTKTLPPAISVVNNTQTNNQVVGWRGWVDWGFGGWFGAGGTWVVNNPWNWNNGWGWGGWGWRTRLTTTTSTSEETTSLGTSVVDIEFLPYIRPRTIVISGEGLKPNSRHYAYMDSTAVSAFCKPLTKIVITSIINPLFDASLGINELITFSSGATANVVSISPLSSTNTRVIYVNNVVGTIAAANTITGSIGAGTAIVQTVTNYSLGDPIRTDEYGFFGIEYNLPENTFRTGTRTFTLLDNNSNNRNTAGSIGDGDYYAVGQLKTEQERLLVTRTTTATVVANRIGWGDPVAESFLVDENVYPNGVYVTSVDLYFATKSTTLPVTVQVREMVNGYPKDRATIPFAEATLYPENIALSLDGTVATRFNFNSPVNLVAGEYCFVVMSNSNEYEIYISVMGESTLTTPPTRVTQQPYAGSMFYSQNGTTWTAQQENDIKFVLNRAVFATSGTGNFVVPDNFLTKVVATRANASPTLTAVADEVFNEIGLGMLVVGAGIPASTYIIGADRSVGTITLSNNATSAGTLEEVSLYGIPEYGTISSNISVVEPDKTTVNFSVKTMSKNTSVMDVDFTPIVNKLDTSFPTIKKLAPSVVNSGQSTVQISGAFTTSDTATSPAVDVGRFNLILAKNVINDLSTGETSIRGGDSMARYITEKITLLDGFDASNLVVTFDCYKPTGTNVKVYMRTLPVEDTSPLDQKSWVEMSLYKAVQTSATKQEYNEHQFYPPGAFGAYGVPVNNPISPRFNNFQIKVVMLSSSEVATPIIKNFRAIALDS